MAKVLIVDDDYSFATYAKFLIDSMGYAATVSLDPEKALALAGSEPPDVILMDFSMPGMDGPELVRRLKEDERTRDIPIILCSITRDKRDVQSAFGAGALEFLAKPLNAGELKARIDEALQLRR